MRNRTARVLHFASMESSKGLGTNGAGAEAARILRFGAFELDLRAGELRRNGLKVKLQEQPFQVLAQLLEKPGDVVTREELRERLWRSDTFVDFDHSLNAAIRRLRDALGDSAENPTFVETVARRGYRFLAPVSSSPANGNSGVMAGTAPIVQVSTVPYLRPWWIVAIAGAVILLAFGLMLGFFLAPHAPVPLRVTRLTANPVDDPVHAAAISRDGRYLAFSDQTGFYFRQIDTGETHSVELPAGLHATSLDWFPDSVHLVVALAGTGHQSGIWELSTLGGSAHKLVDDGWAPAVCPDGERVAYIAGPATHQRIWLAKIDGAQAREFVGEDGDLFGAIAWSPEGKRIAYTSAKFVYGQGEEAVIATTEVQQPHADVIPRSNVVISLLGLQDAIAWASDGRLIYAVSEPRPLQFDSNLWSVRLNGRSKLDGAPLRLTTDQGTVISISASAGGKRIVYVKGVPEPDVYVSKLGDSGALSEPQRLTLDDRQDLPFDWTADGKQVIFASDRTGTFNIYKQAFGQAVPDVVVGGNQSVTEPRLSPDGTQLLYVVYPNSADTNYQVPLMRVPLAGGAPQQLVKANWITNHQCARFTASICVYSVVRPGSDTFFTFDPVRGPGRQIFQIKDDPSQIYNWSLSPDGTTLAIVTAKRGTEEPGIHLISLNGAAERWLTIKASAGLVSLDWAADSKGLWAATAGGEGNELLYIDLQGNARAVWHPQKLTVRWAIPSRDGKSLALNVNSSSANVWMLDRP